MHLDMDPSLARAVRAGTLELYCTLVIYTYLICFVLLQSLLLGTLLQIAICEAVNLSGTAA